MKRGSELHSHVGRLYGMNISFCFFTMSPIDAHLLLFAVSKVRLSLLLQSIYQNHTFTLYS